MDNFGGHESDIVLPGLRIELLPPQSTAKYQTLDLGLVSHNKINYRFQSTPDDNQRYASKAIKSSRFSS